MSLLLLRERDNRGYVVDHCHDVAAIADELDVYATPPFDDT